METTIIGHAADATIFVLGHIVTYGSALDPETWRELDDLLKMRFGALKIDAAIIDGGDGGHYDTVMAFARSRSARRILCGKGVAGFSRPAVASSKTKKGRLFLIGVDSIKSQIVARLAKGRSIRFSNSLDATYFEQLASEKRVVRMVRGKPQPRLREEDRTSFGIPLDALTYSIAARSAVQINFSERSDAASAAAAGAPPPPQRPNVIRSAWMNR